MFVEGLKGADEDPAVLQDAPHPEVNVLQHLAALTHRLKINHRQTLLRHHNLFLRQELLGGPRTEVSVKQVLGLLSFNSRC